MLSNVSFKLTKPIDHLMCNLKRSGAFTEKHDFVKLTKVYYCSNSKGDNFNVKQL